MTKKNLNVEFNNGKCLIKDASNVYQVVGAGYEEDGLYRIEAKVVGESALMTTAVYQSKLWHHMYGHLNFQGLHLLHRLNMVHSFPHTQTPKEFCEGCILGKEICEWFFSILLQIK